MALMVLQYIPDEDDPWGIVRQLLEAIAPGSYLTVSDTIRDIDTARVTEGAARLNERMPTRLNLRTRPEWERFFDNLELVEPGIVPLPEWRGPGSEHPNPLLRGNGPQASAGLAAGGVRTEPSPGRERSCEQPGTGSGRR